MNIQVDTREHKKEWLRIKKQFDALGVSYFRSKMYVGDYMSLDNPRLCIDRKKNLEEICSNVGQDHDRFRDELIRANEAGIKLVILCEHGEGITCIEDVMFWQNPARDEYEIKMVDGMLQKVYPRAKATNGDKLFRSLWTIKTRYNVDFFFCNKSETGEKIVEILGGDIQCD